MRGLPLHIKNSHLPKKNGCCEWHSRLATVTTTVVFELEIHGRLQSIMFGLVRMTMIRTTLMFTGVHFLGVPHIVKFLTLTRLNPDRLRSAVVILNTRRSIYRNCILMIMSVSRTSCIHSNLGTPGHSNGNSLCFSADRTNTATVCHRTAARCHQNNCKQTNKKTDFCFQRSNFLFNYLALY